MLHRSRELEAAIAADPDSIAAYQVYADWLMEREDPRGDLIAIACAIRAARLPAEIAELRKREAALFAVHGAHFVGPAKGDGFDPKLYLGFVDSIEVDDDALEELPALFAEDHPALAFLRTIIVSGADIETARALVPAGIAVHGERVFDPRHIDAVRVTVVHRDNELVATFNEEIAGGGSEYSYIVRAQLGDERWFHGSGSALTEEQICDDPAKSGGIATALATDTELSLEIRYRSPSYDTTPTRTAWLAGRAIIPAGAPTTAMLVHACEPLTGPPFERSPIVAIDPPRGPVLVDVDNSRGAAMPGIGVYLPDTNRLASVAADGTIEVSGVSSFAPPGDVYLRSSHGATNGTVAIIHAIRRTSGEYLTFARPPSTERRAVAVQGSITTAAFDPTGAWFACMIYRSTGLVISVFDVATAREIATSTPVAWRTDATHDLAWRGTTVTAFSTGLATILDVPANTTSERSVPAAITFGWRQYGAGAPSYNAGCDRTAWMMCAEFGDRTLDGRGSTIIGWRDGDGGHGAVVVPDEGWGEGDARFATVVIFDDGRILGIGTRLWLVARDGSIVHDLGAAGVYPIRPLVVGDRLYSQGVGPWWIEIPR